MIPKTATAEWKGNPFAVNNSWTQGMGKQVQANQTLLLSSVTRILEFTIRDQYGDVLHTVYDGPKGSVTEDLIPLNGNMAPPAATNQDIDLPTGQLANGKIEDAKSRYIYGNVPFTYSAQQRIMWGGFNLQLNSGFNNLLAQLPGPQTGKWKQKLTVQGHSIDTEFTFEATLMKQNIQDPQNAEEFSISKDP